MPDKSAEVKKMSNCRITGFVLILDSPVLDSLSVLVRSLGGCPLDIIFVLKYYDSFDL